MHFAWRPRASLRAFCFLCVFCASCDLQKIADLAGEAPSSAASSSASPVAASPSTSASAPPTTSAAHVAADAGHASSAGARIVTGSTDPAALGPFELNRKALCRRKNEAVWWSGWVRGKEGGRLLVDYDDGVKEAIGPSLCQRHGPEGTAVLDGRPVVGNQDFPGAAKYAAGEKVRCARQLNSGGNSFFGAVNEVKNGFLYVDFDDGPKMALDPSYCPKRAPRADGRDVNGGPGRPDDVKRFRVDERVACKSGAKDLVGTVKGFDGGWLLVDYDNGRKEAVIGSLCLHATEVKF